jgi:TRAP-type mannitol/chloroaromatic compound transport system permease small subunit
MRVRTAGRRLQAVIGRLVGAAGWLVLPMVMLLLAQWPLRDAVQAYSAQANDLAQVLFAAVMAAAVAAATRRDVHLRTHHRAHGGRGDRWRETLRAAVIVGWAALVLVASAAGTWRSLLSLERFAETDDFGYFLIRAALWLLVLLVALQTTLQAARRVRGR